MEMLVLKEETEDVSPQLSVTKDIPKKQNLLQETELTKGRGYRMGKRFMDIVCSCLALVVLSPIFALTALAIFLEDGGPVFFFQERSGKDGEVFRMFKFRSMCKDASKIHKELLAQNEMGGPVFKIKHDPRVTKVGEFIRRTSIDELPQLVNIIRGEMSLVGPRPLPTYETEQCNQYQKQRLAVKPGLTCYWQVNGRNDIEFSEWVEMDLQYIKEANLLLDVKLVCKTIGVVLAERGAY